jgi:hypothetical protein
MVGGDMAKLREEFKIKVSSRYWYITQVLDKIVRIRSNNS